MKKIISTFLFLAILSSFFTFDTVAVNEKEPVPTVLSFALTTDFDNIETNGNDNTRVSGLISAYALSLEKTGTTLKIYGQTLCTQEVVKCGFKNLVIQRRASSSDSWKDYYDYGNVYVDVSMANLSTTLSVASGYQYRISCKHYAKKSLFVTQSISNTSNTVTVA